MRFFPSLPVPASYLFWRAAPLVLAALLAACTSTPRAPVENRTAGVRWVDPKTLPGYAFMGQPGYYTVQAGDTMRAIARRFGLDWRVLSQWNRQWVPNPDQIEIGQVLRVEPPAGSAPAPAYTPPVPSQPAHAAGTPVPAPVPGAGTALLSELTLRTSTPAATGGAAGGSVPATPPAAAATAAGGTVAMARSSAGSGMGRAASSSSPVAKKQQESPKAVQRIRSQITLVWPTQSRRVVGAFSSITNGIGIAGKAGAPVTAAADGEVLHVGTMAGYGRVVSMQHKPGYITSYTHLAHTTVQRGQKIRAGQQLGTIGSNYLYNNQPALHFELRTMGRALNPLDFLPSK